MAVSYTHLDVYKRQEQGKILKNGKEVAIRNPNDANALGIGMVHQHFKLDVYKRQNYFYGGQFYGDANITSRMEGWYANGTQIVFACGGGIYTSAVEAALKNNG